MKNPLGILNRIAERICFDSDEIGARPTSKRKWFPIKDGDGKVCGYVEMFWGGKRLGWVTIPGASRVADAGSERPQ